VEGTLVPPGNVSALADALIEMLGDPDQQRLSGRRGRAKVRQEFGIEQYVRGHEQLYLSLVAPERRAEIVAVAEISGRRYDWRLAL
jgi:glycosyltransferase involved in cell wall biosynthesis